MATLDPTQMPLAILSLLPDKQPCKSFVCQVNLSTYGTASFSGFTEHSLTPCRYADACILIKNESKSEKKRKKDLKRKKTTTTTKKELGNV